MASEVDFKALAYDQRLDGFTGADLSNIIREASLAGLRERINGLLPPDQKIILKNSHFNFAMDKVRPSVSIFDRAHYLKMMERYS